MGPGTGLQRGGKCQQEGACRALAGAGRRRLERVLLCPPHFPAPCCLPCHCSSAPGVRHGVETGCPSSLPPACPSAPAPTPPPRRRCPCPAARARATGSPGTWGRGTLPSCLARHPAAVGNSNRLIPGWGGSNQHLPRSQPEARIWPHTARDAHSSQGKQARGSGDPLVPHWPLCFDR